MKRRAFLTASAGMLAAPLLAQRQPAWRAGVAAIDITPRTSMWMAGFAARKHPSQGVALPLHAKALAFEDARGRRAVILTVDLLGVTAGIATRLASAVARQYRIPRERLLVAASHTHCGPVVDGMLSVAYDLDAAQRQTIAAYTRALESQLLTVIGDAIANFAPATLHTGESRATFAANRRVQFSPDGPVDHRVPMLRVDVDGAARAVLFGYACHNTTLPADVVEFHGDYAGVAQTSLEATHKGMTAMFVAGCGADANPKPRGTRALVEQHGASLADAVSSALTSLDEVRGPLDAAFDTVSLPFAASLQPAEWAKRFGLDDVYVQRHAELMREVRARAGRLPRSYPMPLQIWRFGRDLTFAALGGEVVVDYALRLQREWPGARLWVPAYANDVFGYVPSRRVLDEGGYEGGGAMLYYGQPGPFDATVEDRIFSALAHLSRKTR